MTENVPDPFASRQKEEHPTHAAGREDEQKSGKDTKAGHSVKPNSANHSANNHSASSPDTVTLTVGLTPAFKRLLEAKAKKQGITVSELLGNILRADIEQHEDDPPTPSGSRGPWYIVLLFASFATFCSLSHADSLTGRVAHVIDPPQSAGAESRGAGGDSIQCLTSKVVRVVDGDTIVLLAQHTENGRQRTDDGKSSVRVRLAEIDAPELRQAYGPEAKAALEAFVLRKTVVINYQKKDRYRRIIGTVRRNGKSINAQMVRHGHAWHYRRYSHNNALSVLEAQAKQKRIGLWQASSRTPPWEFREMAGK